MKLHQVLLGFILGLVVGMLGMFAYQGGGDEPVQPDSQIEEVVE